MAEGAGEVNRRKAGSKGQAMMVLALLGLLVIVTIVTLNAALVRMDVQQTTTVGGLTRAFQAADSGLERGIWKLSESASVWNDARAGVPIAGYDGNTVHVGGEGTSYRIWFSTAVTTSNSVKVISSGRYRNSIRTVEAIVQRQTWQTLDSAIWSRGEVEIDGNVEVHWGPIRSRDEIDLSGAAARMRFPLLYARLEISPEPPYDTDSDPPNTDNTQYWAFFDVPDRPQIDFAAIKASAQANGTYFTSDQNWSNANPSGSCSGCPSGVKDKLDDNLWWYFEGDLKLIGQTYIIGQVVVMGELSLSGTGAGVRTGANAIPIPSGAPAQYVRGTPANPGVGDTAASNEWPGDIGGGPPSTSNGTFEFGRNPAGPLGTGTNRKISILGAVYSRQEFDATGSNVIVGTIIVDQDEVENKGTTFVYYAPDFIQFPIALGALKRISWNEVQPYWP